MLLPDEAELEVLRRGLRRRKPPTVQAGDWFCAPVLGEVRFLEGPKGIEVRWRTADGPALVKSAAWAALCDDAGSARQRLEVGLLVEAILRRLGQTVMDGVGQPVSAMKLAAPYFSDAARWRHWALVRPRKKS